nr:hypothetical protein [Tanacetum cinerariifolium]
LPLTIAPSIPLFESTPPVLVPILCRTAHMVVRVPPTMSPGFSASITEVAAMSDSTFCKMFRSSYESSPSVSPPDLPLRKLYRAPSVIPLLISSPMISLTVPSPVATPATAETKGFLTELRAQFEMQEGLIRDHTIRLGELSPALFERHGQGRVYTRMIDMLRVGYDDHRLVYDMLVQQATLQRELQEIRDRVTALEQERDRRER